MRVVQQLTVSFVSLLALSGCGGGCFTCEIMGDADETAHISTISRPMLPDKTMQDPRIVDASCHDLATQRANDEASLGFDQAIFQQIIERTYSDCIVAKGRYGSGH